MVKRISICFAERAFKEGGDTWSHAFLFLMKETNSCEFNIKDVLQQLHYKDSFFDSLTAVVREGMSDHRDADDLTIFPYISGNDSDILPRWNFALKYAHFIKNQGLEFVLGCNDNDKTALNCRTAAKATIEVMGLDFCAEFTKSARGIKSMSMPSHGKFVMDAEKTSSPDDLWAENRMLSSQLLEC